MVVSRIYVYICYRDMYIGYVFICDGKQLFVEGGEYEITEISDVKLKYKIEIILIMKFTKRFYGHC